MITLCFNIVSEDCNEKISNTTSATLYDIPFCHSKQYEINLVVNNNDSLLLKNNHNYELKNYDLITISNINDFNSFLNCRVIYNFKVNGTDYFRRFFLNKNNLLNIDRYITIEYSPVNPKKFYFCSDKDNILNIKILIATIFTAIILILIILFCIFNMRRTPNTIRDLH